MAFQIALTQPRYHRSTDALIGSTTQLLTELGSFETLAWADTKVYLLSAECDFDSDLTFTVRDCARPDQPLYPKARFMDSLGEIPF